MAALSVVNDLRDTAGPGDGHVALRKSRQPALAAWRAHRGGGHRGLALTVRRRETLPQALTLESLFELASGAYGRETKPAHPTLHHVH
jgi:hypothetical protein